MSEIDLSSPLNYGTPSSLGSVRTPRSGIRGTPIRMRPDVRSDKRIRQVNVGASDQVSLLLFTILHHIALHCKMNIFVMYIKLYTDIHSINLKNHLSTHLYDAFTFLLIVNIRALFWRHILE